jgi:chemotaxis protein methyltransferase CheR
MSEPGALSTPGRARAERADDIVRRRFGLVIHKHQRARFERTLDSLAGALGFPDRESYLEVLCRADDAAPEVERLLCAVTVGESYFFRDSAQVEFLEQRWIPDLIARQRHGERSVRVWSAGCSQGQELYTVALLLDRRLPERESWEVDLVGTDINPAALDAATAGRYREWSLRATPQWARSRYFEAQGTEWLLSARIRSMARFAYLNLADERASPASDHGRPFDLILCRNVFIYFDREVVASVMRRFARRLDPEGVLLLGPADIVSEDTGALELEHSGRAHLYRPRIARSASLLERNKHPCAPLDTVSERAAVPTSGDRPTRLAADPDAIDELLRRGAWEAAANAADAWLATHGESAHVLARKARAHANLGRHESALDASDRAVALDPVSSEAHFIRGLTLIERDNHSAAESALRKAIFLDHDFLEAHHQLGVLLIRRSERGAGLRSLRTALAIAERRPAASCRGTVPYEASASLPDILRAELARHGDAAKGVPA